MDTLEYLQKGGRIGLVSSLLGSALKLKPIISCNSDGIYYTVAKVRGLNKSIDKTIQLVKEHVGNHKRFNLAVTQADALETAEKFANDCTSYSQQPKIFILGKSLRRYPFILALAP